MADSTTQKADIQVYLRRILDRHPDGVTPRQLIGGLVGSEFKHSQCQMAVQEALDRGWAVLGAGMKIYSPQEPING